jgi:glycogen operon protein
MATPQAARPSPVPADGRVGVRIDVHAPDASTLTAVWSHDTVGAGASGGVTVLTTVDGRWQGRLDAPAGARWSLVDQAGRHLVDPDVEAVRFVDGVPVGVVRAEPWPRRRPLGRHPANPVVYEVHVRGFGRTFAGCAEHLGHLADLGVDVVELMPVHPFDTSDNYWGYMPVVWGAVHGPYADDGVDPAVALADFVEAAHDHGIAVWLDVVFNHTGEGDASRPTWTLRGLDDRGAYRWWHDRDGVARYTDDSGCGNDTDPASPEIRRLVLAALDRYADLGIDGFRFDLASLLTRDGGDLVRAIGDWAERRDVVLVAEAWDLAAYQVGRGFPDRRWAQWNDRFRDDVRGFLRAEPGKVAAVAQRIAGSPDLFGAGDDRHGATVNFLTAHDGLTLHDLTAVTSDRHHAWDCGPSLRPQMLTNAMTMLLLSAGSAMFVMGDEFARTQDGHDNPYDVDGPLTWVDWSRLEQWRPLHDTVRHLLRIRRALDHHDVVCFGARGSVDTSFESRSLGWRSGGVCVLANMWWESVTFFVPDTVRTWRVALESAPSTVVDAAHRRVAPRSVVVMTADS